MVRRLCGDGRGPRAVEFRRGFEALEQRVGSVDDALVPLAAGVVVLGLEWQRVTCELARAQDARQRGKGRRPSAARVAALRKRQSLGYDLYAKALKDLEERVRVAAPRGGGSLEAALA